MKLNEFAKSKKGLFELEQKGKEFYWGNRFLGRISEDGKRFVTWRHQKHFFIKHRGFGFNKELIHKLIFLGVEEIILIYKKQKGGEILFKTTPKIVRDKGFIVKEKYFEEQYILKIDLFERRE